MPRLLQDGSTRLIQGGAANRLLLGEVPAPTEIDYSLRFENHLSPIRKRGKVRLKTPLAEGARLRVIRKTPISTTFNAPPLRPFPTEQLEYTLDQICYIQQEIEGHACDCRGNNYPGTPKIPGEPEFPDVPEPDNPECLPYSCDSFTSKAGAAGYTAINMSQFWSPPVTVPLLIKDIDGNDTDVRLIPSKVGSNMNIDASNNHYFLGAINSNDLCAEVTHVLGLGENALNAPAGAKLTFLSNTDGVALMGFGGLSSTNNGDRFFFRRFTWTIQHPTGFRSGELPVGVRYDNNNGFFLNDGVGGLYFGNPTFNAGLNEIIVSARISNARAELVGSNYMMMVDHAVRVIVNDAVYEVTKTVPIGGTYSSPPVLVASDYEAEGMFDGMRWVLAGMAKSGSPMDEQLLQLSYAQNKSDYQRPGYCEFSGGELP